MATVLSEFPIKPPKDNLFESYFDGQVWKLAPDEFDLEMDDTKGLRNRVSAAGKKAGHRLRTCVTLDNHVVVQVIPKDAPLTKHELRGARARAAKAAKRDKQTGEGESVGSEIGTRG